MNTESAIPGEGKVTYDIYFYVMMRETEGGIQSMCNLGEGLIEKYEARGERKNLVEIYQEFGKSKDDTIEKLMDKFQMSREEAEENVKKYWKN